MKALLQGELIVGEQIVIRFDGEPFKTEIIINGEKLRNVEGVELETHAEQAEHELILRVRAKVTGEILARHPLLRR